MNELLSAGLWKRITKLAKSAKRKYAAIAYVTDDTKCLFRKGDVLVTDASDEAIKSGQTSAAVLNAAWKRKAEIFSVSGLHAKVYVFDRHAVIGSANLSKGSERLIEAALITDQATVVSAAREQIDNLKDMGDPVDEAFISRINKIPVQRRLFNSEAKNSRPVEDMVPRTWLVGLKPLGSRYDEDDVEVEGRAVAEKKVSEKDNSVFSIRFRGKSQFREEAKKGDVIIRIWTETTKGKPAHVFPHAKIVNRVEDAENDVTWLYVEDSPDAEYTTLSWKRFQRLCDQIGLPGKLSQWAHREIPHRYSDALGNLW